MELNRTPIIVAVIGLLMLMYFIPGPQATDENGEPATSGGAGESPDEGMRLPPDPLASVTALLQQKKYPEALTMARNLAGGHRDARVRGDAEDRIGFILSQQCRDLLKAGKTAEAASVLRELSMQDDRYRTAQILAWGDFADRSRELLKKNDTAGITSLLKDLSRVPLARDNIPALDVVRNLQQRLMETFTKEFTGGKNEAAFQLLIPACEHFIGQDMAGPDIRALPAETLLVQGGKFLAQGGFGAANLFAIQAWNKSNLTEAQRKDAGDLRERSLEGAASKAALDGIISNRYADSADFFFERLAGDTNDPAKRLQYKEHLYKSVFESARAHLEKGRFPEAWYSFRAAEEKARDLFQARLQVPGFDPWNAIGSAASIRLQRQLPALQSAIAKGGPESPIPEVRDIQALLPELSTGWGLVRLQGDRDAGLEMLLQVLRNTPSPTHLERIRSGLRAEILRSAKDRRFEEFVDFVAFHVSEFGTPARADPFYQQLIKAFESSTDPAIKQPNMRRIFLLTLLADTFPDEPAGQAAREEALQKGIEVAGTFASVPFKTDSIMGSGLKGFSAAAVENSTSDHLLLFYDGPERFFVRVNPFRRGTFVFRDGSYVFGVMVTDDDVKPYRSQGEYQSQWSFNRYYIRITGGNPAYRMPATISEAQGDYRLLRNPSEAGALRIDPKTGQLAH